MNWREKVQEKYSIPKNLEMDLWKSNVERIKNEIEEKIEEIRQERKKDTKSFLNCFFENQKFSKHMDEIFRTIDRKITSKKRKFEEI